MTHLAAFLGVAALVIATPGQDTALTIRNTLLGGRTAGISTAAGVALGQAAWTLATAAGVGALLVASQPAFEALRVAGGVYLVFLGAHALSRAVRGRRGTVGAEPRAAAVAPRAAARQGLLSNLGNPKMLAFFTSLLPQFGQSFAALALLGLLFCSLTLAWLTAYAFAVARAGDVLRRPRIRRVIEAVMAAVLVAFGLRLAAERG